MIRGVYEEPFTRAYDSHAVCSYSSGRSTQACHRQPEVLAMIGGEDLSAASAAWKACFGKDGNFTVIVEEPSSDINDASDDANMKVETEAKRTEFQVWCSMLSHHSPVFEKMIGSTYAESQRAEVVIQDFSAGAVEIFLRYLYTGSVRGSASALLEVAALADKYHVEVLHALCMRLVREAFMPVIACEVFAAADRFHMEDLRLEALELILTQPAEALQKRPALRPELLEEILESGLLCMSGESLEKTLQSWGDKEDPLQPIIKARVPSTPVRPIRQVSLRGEHTTNVLQSLWKRYCDAGKKGTFVGYWVNVLLGPGQSEVCTQDRLLSMASGSAEFTFRKGWVQWYLPYCSVHLQGFCFKKSIPASASFRIHVKSSEDGATWQLAYESHKQEIKDGTFLPCKRPQGLVQYFKLEVLEGELGELRSPILFSVQGILQTSV